MDAVQKIVIIGGESTGKSTLCEQLADVYGTNWVAEYARNYLEKLNRPYVYEDLLLIAKGQIEAEGKGLIDAKRFLFCDTDLQVIQVWSDHKYKRCDNFILEDIKHRKYDAYILMAPDFPWEMDPLREHPEPQMRSYFFEIYKNMLANKQIPFCIGEGNQENRLLIATQFLENLGS